MCIAALRALCSATETELTPEAMVALADAQTNAGVSLTGSIDDAWAWHDAGMETRRRASAHRRRRTDGRAWPSGRRMGGPFGVARPSGGATNPRRLLLLKFTVFQQALAALQDRNPLVALTWNGRGLPLPADIEGRKMTNDSYMNSARAAGITGSGPALVIVVPLKTQKPTIERIKSWYGMRYPGAGDPRNKLSRKECSERYRVNTF